MTPALKLSLLIPFLAVCSSASEPSGHPVQMGEEQLCDSPGEGLDRFVEAAASHGLVRQSDSPSGTDSSLPGGVGMASSDADGDGDLDLFFSVQLGFPQVFENDGDGHFTEVAQTVSFESFQDHELLGFGLLDFDGDGRRDILLFGPRSVVLSRNMTGLEYGSLRTVYSDSANEVGAALSAAFADVDLDGDLDLFLPGLDAVGGETQSELGEAPSADRLLFREKARFVLGTMLQGESGPGLSMVGLFTDRDGDGDQDLLVPSLRSALGVAPTAFYRNTGADEVVDLLQEDAALLHADLLFSGMGIDSADLNGDGDLDYCISGLNGLRCLLSDGSGGYHEAAKALGLSLPELPPGSGWSGGSMDFVDLDNDSQMEVVVAGGSPIYETGDGLEYSFSPSLIWQGGEDAFGLHSPTFMSGEGDHHAMLSADLNGDGALELLFAGADGELEVYYNQCTAGSWVDVQLAGPVGNEQGIGARIFLRSDKRRQARQIQGLRGFAQGPAKVHFGLGDAKLVDKLTVIWPDGNITISRDLPVNRSLRVPHPSRFVGEGETGQSETGVDSGIVGGMASLSGNVTRSASLIEDGIGELFVLLFEMNPVESPGSPPLAWMSMDADFSEEGAVHSFQLDDVPLGSSAYHVLAFLDDNGNGFGDGPDSGDLIATMGAMAFPVVHFEQAIEYELDLDLNFGIP